MLIYQRVYIYNYIIYNITILTDWSKLLVAILFAFYTHVPPTNAPSCSGRWLGHCHWTSWGGRAYLSSGWWLFLSLLRVAGKTTIKMWGLLCKKYHEGLWNVTSCHLFPHQPTSQLWKQLPWAQIQVWTNMAERARGPEMFGAWWKILELVLSNPGGQEIA